MLAIEQNSRARTARLRLGIDLRSAWWRLRRSAAMTAKKSGSYEVGYGHPPAKYRFQKGVSGNPEGRAKGTRNFATLFMKAMTKSVTITENGKRKKIFKLEAAVTQLANDAARGDKKAIQLAVTLLQICEPAIESQRPVHSVLITGVLAEGARTV
jgi:Family of unknown function (DUF5681)